MLPETIMVNTKEISKKKTIGFHAIPEKYIDGKDVVNCVKSMQEQLSIDPEIRDGEIKKFQAYLAEKGLKGYPKETGSAEREKKHAIHQELVTNLTTSYAPRLFYEKDLTRDYGLRFVSSNIMHRQGEGGDKQFNQHITDLLTRAANRDFADEKIGDDEAWEEQAKLKEERAKTEEEWAEIRKERKEREKTKAERNELLSYFKEYLKPIEQVDVKKIVEQGHSDEELAKDPLYFSDMALRCGQFPNILGNLKKWGIKDREIENFIQKYESYDGYFSSINQRLGCILDPAYELFDEPSMLEAADFMWNNGLDPEELEITNKDRAISRELLLYGAQLRENRTFAGYGEANAILCLFKDLGFPKEDIVCVDPHTQKETAELRTAVQAGEPISVYSKSQRDFKMTFDSYPDVKITRMLMAEKELDFQKVVKKPKAPGFFDNIADAFSNFFSGKKPRAEKYAKEVTRYNNLAVIFDPKSVIPTDSPQPKNPMHDLFKVRHFLKQDNKTEKDFRENLDLLNKMAATTDGGEIYQKSVKFLAQKYNKELETYNAEQTDPSKKVALMGRVAELVTIDKQPEQVQQGQPEQVQQSNSNIIEQPSNPEIIEGQQPVQQPNSNIIEQSNPQPQPKVEQKPKPWEVVRGLRKELDRAKRYIGEDKYWDIDRNRGVKHVAALLEGRVSLHKPASESYLESNKPTLVAAALFGQAPEKFPGKAGLTPMEKKMQFLSRVMTEKDFTKSKEYTSFMGQCYKDYNELRTAAYRQNKVKDEKNSDARKFFDYLNEGARSIQHLALKSSRMTITAPMLGACARVVVKEILQGYDGLREKFGDGSVRGDALYTEQDKNIMDDALKRVGSVMVLGRIHTYGVKGELELAQIHESGISDEEKKEYLTNLMVAKVVNQTIIAPSHEEAASAVKEGKHPDADKLFTLGNNTVKDTMDIMRQAIVKTPTFEALMKVGLDELRDAIKVHPEKIASAAADISAETYTGKPAREKVEEGIKQLFKIGAPAPQNEAQNVL